MMLVIKRADPDYADEVVIWLTRMCRTGTGKRLVRVLREAEGRVLIRKPDAVDPPNAWAVAAADGCAIHFDPRDWPHPLDAAGRTPDTVFYGLLQEAERMVAGGEAPAAEIAAYQAERLPQWGIVTHAG